MFLISVMIIIFLRNKKLTNLCKKVDFLSRQNDIKSNIKYIYILTINIDG